MKKGRAVKREGERERRERERERERAERTRERERQHTQKTNNYNAAVFMTFSRELFESTRGVGWGALVPLLEESL